MDLPPHGYVFGSAGPDRAIQFPHGQAIACSKLFKAFLKLRPICRRAGLPIVGKDLFAAVLLQGSALHAGVVLVLG